MNDQSLTCDYCDNSFSRAETGVKASSNDSVTLVFGSAKLTSRDGEMQFCTLECFVKASKVVTYSYTYEDTPLLSLNPTRPNFKAAISSDLSEPAEHAQK